ncbi:MAG TPA: hypothetical protein VGP68_03225 [Gemmataceae bacterium]|nr:hypothetical protein [Gemmataceae bacterium]
MLHSRLELCESNEPRQAREAFGFTRTICACAICQAPCHHIPGSLDVADLPRLCPPSQNVFTWAEEHLRAIVDKGYPTLVPSRGANSHCHWLFEGRCSVHAVAPYSCAFFDSHMTDVEIDRRSAATIKARRDDAAANGLYYQVWLHLCRKNLIGPPGDRAGLAEEVSRLRHQA